MAKSKKSKSSPNTLAKTGKASGIEVNETELEQVSGGSVSAADGSVMKWSAPITAPVFNGGFKI